MPLREIAGPAGRIEALLDEPDGGAAPRAAVVLAHPHPQYGGTMHTKAVYQAAKAFSRIGCAALRFNFRGAGASAGSFSDGPGEMDDCKAALEFMANGFPNLPLWAGGMSFGSWVAMTVGADEPRVTTLFGIAMPVTRYDWTALERSTKPKFFIQGERDELCPLKEMRAFYARCADPKELVVIDAADHLFDGQVGEVADAIEDLFGDWSG
jgi:alpha/beta superfamily hydrolase